jgi:hypothetical protein
MSEMQFWVLSLPLLFAACGTGLVFFLMRFARGHGEKQQDKNTIELECSVCHRNLVFNTGELVSLSPAEMALTVSARPNTVGRKLAEYICPHCEAAHCFAVDVTPPVWLGANFCQPQGVVGHCTDCKRKLRNPTWALGRYDGKISEAPELLPDHGLTCTRCGTTCCVACIQRYSAGRSNEGELFCPRCSRQPIDKFYHY